jgi:hypothetical protein
MDTAPSQPWPAESHYVSAASRLLLRYYRIDAVPLSQLDAAIGVVQKQHAEQLSRWGWA